MSIDVEEFILTIRQSFIGADEVYTRGSCYQFYKILKFVFPNATPWYSQEDDHVVTCINGCLYDINGFTTVNETYMPMSELNMIHTDELSVAKYSIFNVRICPNCDEAINYTCEDTK